WMITSGILNLTHRTSHEQPAPLEPGRSYEIELPLVFVSQRLRAGNRLRIAVSENFWPLVWPSPQIATLTLTAAVSTLTLPTRRPRTHEDAPKDQVLRDRTRMQGTTNPRGGVQVTRAGPDDTGWVTVTKVFAPEEDEVKAIGTRVLRGWTPTTFRMRE